MSSVAQLLQAQQFIINEIMDLEALWVWPTPRAVVLLRHMAELEFPSPRDPGSPGTGPSASASAASRVEEHEDTPAAKRRKTEGGFVAA